MTGRVDSFVKAQVVLSGLVLACCRSLFGIAFEGDTKLLDRL